MPTFFKLNNDDYVCATRRGPAPQGGLPPNVVAVSETDYRLVERGMEIPGTGDLRWKYIGGVLEEQTDTRPVGTWSATKIDLDIDDPPGSVQLNIGSINGDRIIEFSSGHKLRLNFTAGVAQLDVPTNKPCEAVLDSSPQVRLTNRLRYRVLGNDLYPV